MFFSKNILLSKTKNNLSTTLYKNKFARNDVAPLCPAFTLPIGFEFQDINEFAKLILDTIAWYCYILKILKRLLVIF